MKKLLLSIVFISLIVFSLYSQEQQFKLGSIAFYNVENLFDTIDTPGIRDSEFSPEGSKNWNTEKYYIKIDRLAEVISKIGLEVSGTPPGIVGLSEVENAEVLHDLVSDPQLKDFNYQVVHISGPDRRGVDCALIYRKDMFTLKKAYSYRLHSDIPDFITRDQLVVNGYFDGEEMTFIVIHYPSRRGGEKRSRPRRAEAANLTRHIVDSLLSNDPNAKIVIMGDFNDDPTDPSVRINLNSTGEKSKATDRVLYSPMVDLHKQGIGSLAYRDAWNLFDMFLLSPAFVAEDKSSYRFYRAFVFNKPYLLQKDGRFKGYPYRTFVGDTFKGGYSDHFPVYLFVIKEVE